MLILRMKAITLILSESLFIFSSAKAADGAPLTCGLGRVPELIGSLQGIECVVNVNSTSVTDAMLNNGECEAPAAYIARINKQRSQMGLPNFATLREFRKLYNAGAKLLVAVPENCDVYEYTITVNGQNMTWRVR